MNTQPFSQAGQVIEVCCEYLSACHIWLCLTYHVIFALEWIYTLQLPECQGIHCPKQARYLAKLTSVSDTYTSDIGPVPSKGFLDIQATTECRFTLERVHDMIITHYPKKPLTGYRNINSLRSKITYVLE